MAQSQLGPSIAQARDTTPSDNDLRHGLDGSDNHDDAHSLPPRNGKHARSISPSTNNNDHSGNHKRSHNHGHGRFHNHHRHLHHHARSEQEQDPQPQSPGRRVRPRADSDLIIIVETVSIIHVIDGSGSIIAFSTLPPGPPQTRTVAAPPPLPTKISSVASELSALPSGVEATLSLGIPTTIGNGDIIPTIPSLEPTVESSSSMPTTFPSLSYSHVTSTPLSGGPIFPTFGGVTNSTTQAIVTPLPSNNSTGSIDATATNGTALITTPLTSSPDPAGLTTNSPIISSTRTSSPAFSTGTTFSTTGGGAILPTGDSFAGNGNDPSAAPPASTESSTPPAGTIAGSVVGGIAGLAILIFFALALLRWKRRQGQQSLESGGAARRGLDGPSTARALGGDGGSGGGAAMSERTRSVPFAVPSALAALSGMRRSMARSGTPPSTAGSGAGERGFSKISGRKLPPVFQFGGDGFSDPRETMMTTDSGHVSYRDSTGMFLGTNQKFAVGAPMRPESGIPVFHEGPSRSPMIDQGPFSDRGPYVRNDTPSLTLSPPPRTLDPVGRSHVSQDGSNRSTLSVSRFTENL